ncbi:hypothetical protein K0M31_014666 [Melipona bicolor]|uniref:Uncharacterized protein n=1 Tax=Melipona bicolor TaxID=60889 RepID=A0AA40FH10_9HYME|nr:hypothetical protein K0M31_014666 [Melipona bicolor]
MDFEHSTQTKRKLTKYTKWMNEDGMDVVKGNTFESYFLGPLAFVEENTYTKHHVHLYFVRYLDRYEKVHFLGEDGQQADDDDEDSRHRKWSARALHSVPLTYNHHQHNVAGGGEGELKKNCVKRGWKDGESRAEQSRRKAWRSAMQRCSGGRRGGSSASTNAQTRERKGFQRTEKPSPWYGNR